MKLDVQRDWGWSDGYLPEVRRILAENALNLFTVRLASHHQDVKQATDMLVEVSGDNLAIAVRLRRANYDFRDLTLRAKRTSGTETELAKIRRGSGDFYLYGWTQAMLIPEWMLVDLSRLRKSGLLDWNWQMVGNKDKETGFIAIPYVQLHAYGCIVSAQIGAPVSDEI